jgi:hypothetical protein
MMLVRWLRRWPLLGYFALSYAISWGGILVVLSITRFDLVQLRPMDTGFIFGTDVAGPEQVDGCEVLGLRLTGSTLEVPCCEETAPRMHPRL